MVKNKQNKLKKQKKAEKYTIGNVANGQK